MPDNTLQTMNDIIDEADAAIKEALADDNRRIDVKLLGRVFGTASSWDPIDTGLLTFYQFTPRPEVHAAGMPSGTLEVNFETGLIEITSESFVETSVETDPIGSTTQTDFSADIVEFINKWAMLPTQEPSDVKGT